MEKIRKNFGFGCMRLPMIGEDVDIEQTKQMVDCFLEQGFNFFPPPPRLPRERGGSGSEGVPAQPLPAGGLCPDRQAERVLF